MEQQQEQRRDEKRYEFGGPIGAFIIICFSHFLLYYVWYSISFHGGFYVPETLMDCIYLPSRLFYAAWTDAFPTIYSVAIYLGFWCIQFALAYVIPGLRVLGLPVPSAGGDRLIYRCNAFEAWLCTLAIIVFGRLTGAFQMGTVILSGQFGSLMTTAVVFADVLSVIIFVSAVLGGRSHRMSGNLLYDFFMGAPLNPRIYRVDLKMFAEVRISWFLLFWLSFGFLEAAEEKQGKTASFGLYFMCFAHGLYAHACAKGEHHIPITWDMFYEKFGWMLIFWNHCLPFLYCAQSYYLFIDQPSQGKIEFERATISCFLLLFGYYLFDTANSQRVIFREKRQFIHVPRNDIFPVFSRGEVQNPKFIKTAQGADLLIDGWWQYLRKPNYAGDLMMALSWGLICGFDSFVPYFYFFWFFGVLVHRVSRDEARCSCKYGEDWKRYCQIVPYRIIPYVY